MEQTKELIAFALPSPLPGYGGWGNGYVAIPKGHPCYGLDRDAIYEKFGIYAPGGLTYSDNYSSKRDPIETAGMWIVGFDTLHYGDTMEVWPDEKSVLAAAQKLKSDLNCIYSI